MQAAAYLLHLLCTRWPAILYLPQTLMLSYASACAKNLVTTETPRKLVEFLL